MLGPGTAGWCRYAAQARGRTRRTIGTTRSRTPNRMIKKGLPRPTFAGTIILQILGRIWPARKAWRPLPAASCSAGSQPFLKRGLLVPHRLLDPSQQRGVAQRGRKFPSQPLYGPHRAFDHVNTRVIEGRGIDYRLGLRTRHANVEDGNRQIAQPSEQQFAEIIDYFLVVVGSRTIRDFIRRNVAGLDWNRG